MTQTKRSTARRSMMAVASVAAAGMVLAACSSGSSSDASSSAAPAASSAAASAAASPAASAAGSAAAAGGVAEAQALVASLEGPVTSWAEVPALSALPDVKGKTVFIVPIGDGVPVINGVRTRAIEQALTAAGATTQMCDGKFNPTDIAGCLKLGDRPGRRRRSSPTFVDYAMVPTAFDAARLGRASRSSSAASRRPGGATADATLAFFDLSGQSVKDVRGDCTSRRFAAIGAGTNGLFLRLTDSDERPRPPRTPPSRRSRQLCPTCTARDGRLHHADHRQAAVRRERGAGLEPGHQRPDRPGRLLRAPRRSRASRAPGSRPRWSSRANGDLAGLQRVKARQAGRRPRHPGHLRGLAVRQRPHAAARRRRGQPDDMATTAGSSTATNVGDLALTPEAYLTLDWYGDDSSYPGPVPRPPGASSSTDHLSGGGAQASPARSRPGHHFDEAAG